MSDVSADIERWRMTAQELRRAAAMLDDERREVLLNMAEAYDQLADSTEGKRVEGGGSLPWCGPHGPEGLSGR